MFDVTYIKHTLADSFDKKLTGSNLTWKTLHRISISYTVLKNIKKEVIEGKTTYLISNFSFQSKFN